MPRLQGKLLVLLLCFAPFFLYPACASPSRYEVLSFFFDGVPDPSKPSKVEKTKGKGVVKKVNPWGNSSVHQPYRERACNKCHSGMENRREKGLDNYQSGKNPLLMDKEKLCRSCHEPEKKKFLHGPVAVGQCQICHNAHTSRFPHLLKVEKEKDLCEQCHTPDNFMSKKRHSEFAEKKCSKCHDPHGSDLPLLLLSKVPPILVVEDGEKGAQ